MDRLETLAKRVNMSRTSVANHLKWLSGEDPTSEKRFYRVVPDLDEDTLGLQTIDVFFETPTLVSMKKVEDLCETHPYTKYRARCYGGESEVFVQFRIPKGTTSTLRKFLQASKRDGDFKDYRILPTENVPSFFSTPRLEYWNIESFTWDFDWSKWLATPFQSGTASSHKQSPSKLDLLAKKDIQILHLLAKGVRRKQRVIIEELESLDMPTTSQEFSRRLRVLKENIITRYHVYLDIEAFDLYSNVIITADCKPDFSKEILSRLKSNPIPFRTTLKIKDDFMFWYLRLPPSHLSRLLNYLHENVDNLRLSTVDYEKTQVYGLWSDAFIEETNSWRIDSDFLLGRDSS